MKTLCLLAVLAFASSAQAAPHGIFWARGQQPKASKGAGNLLYYGGPVISSVKVYAVLWGNRVDAETTANVGPFYSTILDSAYMDWLNEYDTINIRAVDGRAGTNQHIGRGRYAGAVTIQPNNASANLTDAMVQQELEAQINAGKLPPSDENTLYMIYFPQGVSISIEDMRSCETFCAYHEGFKAKSGAPIYYGVMPVCGGFGCGFGSKLDNLTFVSSHECAEAVTDPFPTPGDKPAYPQAWNTTGGEEIGDLCPRSSTVSNTTRVTQLWDNRTSSCNPGPWSRNMAFATLSSKTGSHFKVEWRPSWAMPAASAW